MQQNIFVLRSWLMLI